MYSSSGTKAGISLFSGCPQADRSAAVVAPAPVSIMNSLRFISCLAPAWCKRSSMAYIAIYADVSGPMAAHAPSHILIDVSLDLVHLANLSVTGNTIDICLYVWFVGKEGIGGSRYP